MDQECLSCCICLDDAEPFPDKYKLRRHYKAFHGECNKRCSYCHNQFKSQDLLDYHLAVEHGRDRKSKKVFCIHCNQSFQYYYGLQSHYVRIHPKYSFSCSKCGNSFLTESVLDEHAGVHKDGSKDPFIVSQGGSA